MGSLIDKLYHLDCEPVAFEQASITSEQGNDVDLWHQRLGHLNGQRLMVTGIKFPEKGE